MKNNNHIIKILLYFYGLINLFINTIKCSYINNFKNNIVKERNITLNNLHYFNKKENLVDEDIFEFENNEIWF
jgi:hypothetical protein